MHTPISRRINAPDRIISGKTTWSLPWPKGRGMMHECFQPKGGAVVLVLFYLFLLVLGWLVGRSLAMGVTKSTAVRILVSIHLPLYFTLPKVLVVLFNITGADVYSPVQVANAIMGVVLSIGCFRFMRKKPMPLSAVNAWEWFLIIYILLTVVMFSVHVLFMDIVDMARYNDGNSSGRSTALIWFGLAAWHLSVLAFAAALLRKHRDGRLSWRSVVPW